VNDDEIYSERESEARATPGERSPPRDRIPPRTPMSSDDSDNSVVLAPDAHSKIVAYLGLRQFNQTGGAGTQMFIGLAVLVAVGGLVTFILWTIFAILFGYGRVSMFWCFVIYLLTVIPLLLWFESKTRPAYLSDRLDAEALDNDPLSTGDPTFNSTKSKLAQLIDIALWPARNLISSYRWIRGFKPGQQLAMFDSAASVIVQMLSVGGSIDVSKLAAQSKSQVILFKTLKWMEEHDLVGHATDNKRVWLSSPFRKELLSLGITAGPRGTIV